MKFLETVAGELLRILFPVHLFAGSALLARLRQMQESTWRELGEMASSASTSRLLRFLLRKQSNITVDEMFAILDPATRASLLCLFVLFAAAVAITVYSFWPHGLGTPFFGIELREHRLFVALVGRLA